MNKKIIVATIASLSLFAIAGVSTLVIKPNTLGFLTKATNEVAHTLVLDRNSVVKYDEESTIISISDYTENGNEFSSDDGYSYLTSSSEVRTNGTDYIFETDNAYGGNGGSIFFNLEFNFQLDIQKGEEISATMFIKEKHYDSHEGTYYYDGAAQEIAGTVDGYEEIAVVDFTYTNESGIYGMKVLSLEFHYSCSY